MILNIVMDFQFGSGTLSSTMVESSEDIPSSFNVFPSILPQPATVTVPIEPEIVSVPSSEP